MFSPFGSIKKKHLPSLLAFFICLVFLVAFSTLSVTRHLHYNSYGYDLGINDQTVWRYSTFQSPVSTIAPLPDRPKLAMHVELVYAIISPIYWIWDSRRMLLITDALIVVSGAYAMFLLAKEKLKNNWVSIAILFSYLMFYGVQNAIWFDVHSTSFAASFIAWFIYALDRRKLKLSLLFFFLAITAKENMATYTLIISLLYLIRRREKIVFFFVTASVAYLLFIFLVYFPHIVSIDYQYQNKAGILSNLNPFFLFNTKEKLVTLFYSFASVGFLPILNPLTLPLIFTHFTTFFVLASELPGAQGLYGHYRITLAPLFAWSTITTIATFSFFNKKKVAIYLVLCAIAVQYLLHLPLSYLTKSWFWTEPTAVKDLNQLIQKHLPPHASVVSQNNITPHISHRDKIYALYPTKKEFLKDSPCGQNKCDWFEWYGSPEYLIADSSGTWDARHLLIDNKEFNNGFANLEKLGVIKLYKKINTARLYKVLHRGSTPIDLKM